MSQENQIPTGSASPVGPLPPENTPATFTTHTPPENAVPATTPPPYPTAGGAPVPTYAAYPALTPPPHTLAIREAAKLRKSPLLILFCLMAGFIYSEVMLRGSLSGIAIPVYLSFYYLIAFWFLSGKEGAFSRASLFLLIPVALLGWSFAFVDSGMTNFITTLVLLVLIPLQLTAMSGVAPLSRISSLLTALKTVVAHPLSNLGSTFRIPSEYKKEKRRASGFSMILIGLLCSLPLVLIFISLFSSGDILFRTGLEQITDFLNLDPLALLTNLMIALISTVFTVPLFLSLRAAKRTDPAEKEIKGKFQAVSIVSFLFGILLIHGIFSAIQISYLFPGVSGSILPAGQTFASFVHEGFAQITFSSLLTTGIILLVWRLTKRNENGGIPLSVKICLTLLTLFDCVLCASSFARMYYYIQAYSLTVLRLTVCWFMALTILLVLGVLLKVWVPKLKLFAWTLVVVISMTLLLGGMNMDRMIARHNINRYIESGFTHDLDFYYFYELSPAILPELERLYAYGDELPAESSGDGYYEDEYYEEGEYFGDDDYQYSVKDELENVIQHHKDTLSCRTWRNFRFYF